MKRKWIAVLTGVLVALHAVCAVAQEANVRVKGEKVLQVGESQVTYMTIALEDEAVAEKINADARRQAQQVLAQYDLSEVNVTVACQAMSVVGGEVLSLRFSGKAEGEKLAHPSRVYYTANYSLFTGERMALDEISDATAIVKAILNKEKSLTFEENEGAEKESDEYYTQQTAYLRDLGRRELTEILTGADREVQENTARAFSYWRGDGTCVISIEMPYALGEFAHLVFAYK